ncbi:polyamine aminopropyltransferase [Leptospira interrogans]|uniref:Polyamine aminopropyltransferase n=1 Tax=Leptospira interrogans serovar Manilae TaxID=214675 RepID=A0AAQ1NY70_LEPIR|nr:polyamine aminopropyltransferase [Leptospira interrogans]AKP27204.1 spermidine synthase [Leptospira interrogans serovar Manilae]AKP30975.1 spermidine synthase [Leptospira interrogans serovar Manilae]EYU62459.1 spermidine synthase [Leptospira interrogans serovar Manilae]MCR8647123.1 spermidine synthase [Leptospira interrogans serovar Bataviae]OAM86659.1 spermidine synthase [Leptospira interrogans serovar Bataviae]
MQTALYISVLIISSCGLVYELLAGTIASYLLGETVTQFSLIIGTYLFSMGVGSWLSKYLEKDLIPKFLEIELAIGLVGGFSSAILYLSFGQIRYFQIPLFLLVILIGILVGLEIPVLLRILKKELQFKELVSRVLSLDYVGALLASILFPIFFAPKLGLMRTGFIFGILNVGVALWGTWVLPLRQSKIIILRAQSVVVLTLLILGFSYSDLITYYSEESLYTDEIILSKQTQYQRIIVTRWKNEIRLFLNGHLQFSSRDEYRYHETLVHPALLAHPAPKKVLVLGGGDGLAVREILKHKNVESVTLVDLDSAITNLFSEHGILKELNEESLKNSKVTVINTDAFLWLEESDQTFDVVLIDFPDPSNFSLGKLYTTAFFHTLKRRMNETSVLEIQSTSPLFARSSYWCIERTIASLGFYTLPLHVYVPSFGEWGFVLAGQRPIQFKKNFPKDLKFLNIQELESIQTFPQDMSRVPVEINRLDNQALVRYYDREWNRILD